MIAYVQGIVEDIQPENAVVDVNGVGINVQISPSTASRLPGYGEEVKLYTYTSVREDAFQLFGFLSRDELNMFKLLITVNGIGPKAGLSILSGMDVDTLKFAIVTGDVRTISKAPGVGKKTADRLILELRGKIESAAVTLPVNTSSGVNPYKLPEGAGSEAVEALCALGYSRSDSLKAVGAIEITDGMDTGSILKKALKIIAK